MYTSTLHVFFSLFLTECSEDKELEEEGEGDDLAREFLPSPPSPHPSPPAGLSHLALSVSVDSARLSMLLSVEEVGMPWSHTYTHQCV